MKVQSLCCCCFHKVKTIKFPPFFFIHPCIVLTMSHNLCSCYFVELECLHVAVYSKQYSCLLAYPPNSFILWNRDRTLQTPCVFTVGPLEPAFVLTTKTKDCLIHSVKVVKTLRCHNMKQGVALRCLNRVFHPKQIQRLL